MASFYSDPNLPMREDTWWDGTTGYSFHVLSFDGATAVTQDDMGEMSTVPRADFGTKWVLYASPLKGIVPGSASK